MKAVVMAGGEGTRLRPMTANQPKPLLPVCNRPIMEHVLRLLKRHGFEETVVTVQFLASLVRNYFGDGEDVGMSLQYATEETPLGTAGSVKNAEDALRDEPFLVISGDALTDMDLTAMVRFTRKTARWSPSGLTRVPNPLEFGIIIVGEDGRIQRFLEKPTWGQVFSDTVNTGIYMMEPEVLAEVARQGVGGLVRDVFPELLKRGAPLYGWIADGYWEDVGTLESYLKAQADVLYGKVDTEIDGFEVSPGVWVAEGAEVDPDAVLSGPVVHRRVRQDRGGRGTARVHRDGRQRGGQGGRVHAPRRGAQQRLRRPGGHPARLRHRQEHRRDAPGADRGRRGRRRRVRDRAGGLPLGRGQGLPVQDHRGRRGREHQRHLGVARPAHPVRAARRVRPGQRRDHARAGVRLASAYATTLKKGSMVTTSRDVSRAARALKRAMQCALNASAINVVDLEAQPLPVARFQTARSVCSGGSRCAPRPGDPQSIDIVFLDERGAELSQRPQRKLERVFSRQEYRRAFPGEIAELTYPSRVVESYTQELVRCVGPDRGARGGAKVVVDCAGGTVSLVLPSLLGRLGVDVLTVNNRLDEVTPTQSLAQDRAGHAAAGRAGRPRPAPPSGSASTRSASGSCWSTRRARASATSGPCWSCWT